MATEIAPLQHVDPVKTREQAQNVRNESEAVQTNSDGTEVTERADAKVAPVANVSETEIERSIEQNGRDLTFGKNQVSFNYDREIDRVIVQIKDENNGEVIRQIPPEEYVNFLARLKESGGAILNEEA